LVGYRKSSWIPSKLWWTQRGVQYWATEGWRLGTGFRRGRKRIFLLLKGPF